MGYAGDYASPQETADAIASAWDKTTDQIGRENQIRHYKASLGMQRTTPQGQSDRRGLDTGPAPLP